MVYLKSPKNFLERNETMELIFYFNRKCPISGYYEPEVVYWMLQHYHLSKPKEKDECYQAIEYGSLLHAIY